MYGFVKRIIRDLTPKSASMIWLEAAAYFPLRVVTTRLDWKNSCSANGRKFRI